MPTMMDVAREAGVGIGTVSRVFAGSPQVTESTRVRVRAAAETLGYTPSRKSPGERPPDGGLIGVLVPFFDEASSFQRLRGIVNYLAPHGYDTVLHAVRTPAHARGKLMELPSSSTLDGLIVMSLPLADHEAERLASADFPTVLVDTTDTRLASIVVDDRAGGSLATNHLLHLGHTEIAFLGEPPRNPFGFVASANREAGYRQAMARAGVDVKSSRVRYGAFLHSAARTMAVDLLSAQDAPTAIVAASDVQAFGVLDAAEQLGMRVPDDVSVIGYDDIDLAAQMGLSTVRQPLVRSGERGAELVVQAVAMGHAHPIVEQLEVELVVRRTSARPVPTRRDHA